MTQLHLFISRRRNLASAWAAALSVIWLTAGGAVAQVAPTSQPTTRPERSQVATPPGFVRLEAEGRVFLTLPADAAWVRSAAGQIPRLPPTTQASDIDDNLFRQKDLLVAKVLTDFPSLTPSQVVRLIDEQLRPALQSVRGVRASMVYVVAPVEHVKQALRDGWADPRFRYNRAADAVEIEQSVALQPAERVEESAVAAFFSPADPESQRLAALGRFVADTEGQVQRQITNRAAGVIMSGFVQFLEQHGLSELPRKEDQDWLVTGLSHVLAAKYLSLVHGSPLREWVQSLVWSPPNAPFNPASIDLLRPLATDQLKPENVQPYLEAKRRKAIVVVYLWMERAGEEKVRAVVEAAGRLRPADGRSLADVVQTASGVDVSKDLAAE